MAYAIRNTLRVELYGGRGRTLAYDISDDRDRVESLGRATCTGSSAPRSPRWSRGSYEAYAYDSNSAQDNNATQVALGLTWDVTAKSTGFAKAGYEWKTLRGAGPVARDRGWQLLHPLRAGCATPSRRGRCSRSISPARVAGVGFHGQPLLPENDGRREPLAAADHEALRPGRRALQQRRLSQRDELRQPVRSPRSASSRASAPTP